MWVAFPVPSDTDMPTVDVTNKYKKSKANTSPNPNGIPGCLLKESAVELGPAFHSLFHQSEDTGVIPTI